jgi:hypothetical protein
MCQLKHCKCKALQSLHKDKFRHDNGICREYIIIVIIIIITTTTIIIVVVVVVIIIIIIIITINVNSEGLDVVPVN